MKKVKAITGRSKTGYTIIPTVLNDGNLEFGYIYDLSGFFAHKLKNEIHSISQELMAVSF